jgi:hypothetical protein
MSKENENLNEPQNTTLNVANIIGSSSFQKAIKEAIEYGKGTDWGYDGEDEFPYDTFDSDESLQEVIRALKEHFL